MTDCMTIITTLKLKRNAATAACRPLARLWNMIFTILDADPVDDCPQVPIAWMPAHGCEGSVSNTLKSDDSVVSRTEWRANRLANALAKAAAGQHAVNKRTARFISDALATCEYGAALAGVTCKAANCYQCTVHLSDGSPTEVRRRDSEPGQRPSSRHAHTVSISWQSTICGSTCVGNAFVAQPTPATRKRKLELAHEDRLEAAFMLPWAKRRALNPLAKAQGPSAAERLASVAARVRNRCRV